MPVSHNYVSSSCCLAAIAGISLLLERCSLHLENTVANTSITDMNWMTCSPFEHGVCAQRRIEGPVGSEGRCSAEPAERSVRRIREAEQSFFALPDKGILKEKDR